MILKLTEGTGFFTVERVIQSEELDYQKGSARVVQHGDNVGLDEVGASNSITLVQPTFYADWLDEFDVAYPTLDSLLTDLRSKIFLDVSGGAGVDAWGPDGTNPNKPANQRTGTVVPEDLDYEGSEVFYDNTTSGLTADRVQAAIDEVASGTGVTSFGPDGTNPNKPANQRTGDVIPEDLDYQADEIFYDNTISGLGSNRVQNAIDEVQSNVENSGTGAFALGAWNYSNFTFTPPGNGEFRFNNADPSLATELYIADFDADGVDKGNVLSLVVPNTILYVQVSNNKNNFFLISIENATDNAGFWTYEVSVQVEGTHLPGPRYGFIIAASVDSVTYSTLLNTGAPQDINALATTPILFQTETVSTPELTYDGFGGWTVNEDGTVQPVYSVVWSDAVGLQIVQAIYFTINGAIQLESVSTGSSAAYAGNFQHNQWNANRLYPVSAGDTIQLFSVRLGSVGAANTTTGTNSFSVIYRIGTT